MSLVTRCWSSSLCMMLSKVGSGQHVVEVVQPPLVLRRVARGQMGRPTSHVLAPCLHGPGSDLTTWRVKHCTIFPTAYQPRVVRLFIYEIYQSIESIVDRQSHSTRWRWRDRERERERERGRERDKELFDAICVSGLVFLICYQGPMYRKHTYILICIPMQIRYLYIYIYLEICKLLYIDLYGLGPGLACLFVRI